MAVMVKKGQYEQAKLQIIKTWGVLDQKLSGQIDYNRTYDDILKLQQVQELEEIIDVYQWNVLFYIKGTKSQK